ELTSSTYPCDPGMSSSTSKITLNCLLTLSQSRCPTPPYFALASVAGPVSASPTPPASGFTGTRSIDTRRNLCLPTFHSTSTTSSPSARATRSAASRTFSSFTRSLPGQQPAPVHSVRLQQKSGLCAHSSCDPLQSETTVYSRNTTKSRHLSAPSRTSPRRHVGADFTSLSHPHEFLRSHVNTFETFRGGHFTNPAARSTFSCRLGRRKGAMQTRQFLEVLLQDIRYAVGCCGEALASLPQPSPRWRWALARTLRFLRWSIPC